MLIYIRKKYYLRLHFFNLNDIDNEKAKIKDKQEAAEATPSGE